MHHKHAAYYYSYGVELTTKTVVQAIPGTPTSVTLLSANCAPYMGSKYTTAKKKRKGGTPNVPSGAVKKLRCPVPTGRDLVGVRPRLGHRVRLRCAKT